jgi:hypothetical protein
MTTIIPTTRIQLPGNWPKKAPANSQMHFYRGKPPNLVGKDGDFCVDPATHKGWTRENGKWVDTEVMAVRCNAIAHD